MIFWKANFVSTSALWLLSLKFHSHPCPFEKIEETSRNMFHKTWHFWLFQESKLVLVPFYSPRWHCHLLWISRRNVLSTTHDRWKFSARCGSRRSARRRRTPWLLWTSLRPVLCENQSRSNAEVAEVLFFMVFFLTNADISWCVEKMEKKTQKKHKLVDKLMSYAWWFEKKKKLSFVALQTFRMHSENFKINPVSTSPMSCATPIPRKTEM